jgi:hypothetical protein
MCESELHNPCKYRPLCLMMLDLLTMDLTLVAAPALPFRVDLRLWVRSWPGMPLSLEVRKVNGLRCSEVG